MMKGFSTTGRLRHVSGGFTWKLGVLNFFHCTGEVVRGADSATPSPRRTEVVDLRKARAKFSVHSWALRECDSFALPVYMGKVFHLLALNGVPFAYTTVGARCTVGISCPNHASWNTAQVAHIEAVEALALNALILLSRFASMVSLDTWVSATWIASHRDVHLWNVSPFSVYW